jgi:hypothetical protein
VARRAAGLPARQGTHRLIADCGLPNLEPWTLDLEPLISIVVLNLNGRAYTLECLRHLKHPTTLVWPHPSTANPLFLIRLPSCTTRCTMPDGNLDASGTYVAVTWRGAQLAA